MQKEEGVTLIAPCLSIFFYNCDILELAVEWGTLPEDYTEKQADKILDNYWNLLANNISQLFKGYRIPYAEFGETAYECADAYYYYGKVRVKLLG